MLMHYYTSYNISFMSYCKDGIKQKKYIFLWLIETFTNEAGGASQARVAPCLGWDGENVSTSQCSVGAR